MSINTRLLILFRIYLGVNDYCTELATIYAISPIIPLSLALIGFPEVPFNEIYRLAYFVTRMSFIFIGQNNILFSINSSVYVLKYN